MTGAGDIMTSLPVEVSSQIFSNLDGRSLLACCRVNEGWDEITNHVPPEIWFRACVDAGISVSSDKYDNAKDWKAFFSSMIQRKDDMKTSACFQIGRRSVQAPLTAIYYHNGKIAVAFSCRIEVWIVSEDRLYREFQCKFETTFLKFDDIILLSGSRDGIVWLWSLQSGRLFRDYSHDEEIPTSFDFLSDCDIFVNSFFEKRFFLTGVRARILSNHSVLRPIILKPQSLIVRVMLAPHPEYPLTGEQKKCFLFCLAMDYICVSTLTFNSSIFCRIEVSRNLDILFYAKISNDIIYKPPGGLRFDGRKLYIVFPAASNGIMVWDFRTNNADYILSDKIVSLLGVGEMYVAYEFKRERNAECIRICNKTSREIVATINLPGRHRLTDDFLCLVETSWLDGLNGENDSRIVCAFISEDHLSVNFITFLPRSQ